MEYIHIHTIKHHADIYKEEYYSSTARDLPSIEGE
jgi:hypothetical protein